MNKVCNLIMLIFDSKNNNLDNHQLVVPCSYDTGKYQFLIYPQIIPKSDI